jgi:hypothetical protein
MDWLIKFLARVLTWLLDFVTWGLLQVLKLLLEGLLAVFDAIPVPPFFSDAATGLSGVPSGVVFFAQAFMIPQGIEIVLSAYLLRFLIRRIPVIG